MRVAIFRTEIRDSGRLGPGPGSRLSFSPIEPDMSRGVLGSGLVPWKAVHVPPGSRVAAEGCTGEWVLFLPGEPRSWTAADLVRRFDA